MAIKIPQIVPLLTAQDIARDYINGPGGTHCLIGWTEKLFGCRKSGQLSRYEILRGCCRGRHANEFNDDRRIPKRDVAAAWNEFVRRLGYTEIVEVES